MGYGNDLSLLRNRDPFTGIDRAGLEMYAITSVPKDLKKACTMPAFLSTNQYVKNIRATASTDHLCRSWVMAAQDRLDLLLR